MVLIYIVISVFTALHLLINLLLRLTEGAPAKDKDILELFEKKGDQYDNISKKWDDTLAIDNAATYELPRIYKSKKLFFYYPYYIEGVGVVPRWYKSKKVIDVKFAELLKESRYVTNKRKKLGLE